MNRFKKINNFNYMWRLLLLMSFLTSCFRNNQPLEPFFRKLDKSLSKEEKRELKTCDSLECILIFLHNNPPIKFINEFKNTPKEVYAMLDSLGVAKDYKRNIILSIAYQKRLNGLNYSIEIIKDELNRYYALEEEMMIKKEISRNQILDSISRINYNRFDIDDTICLILPIVPSGDEMTVTYRSYYDTENFTDTLSIKGLLRKKDILKRNESFATSHDTYLFRVKILDSKYYPSRIIESDFHNGKEVTIPLYSYGRIIYPCEGGFCPGPTL